MTVYDPATGEYRQFFTLGAGGGWGPLPVTLDAIVQGSTIDTSTLDNITGLGGFAGGSVAIGLGPSGSVSFNPPKAPRYSIISAGAAFGLTGSIGGGISYTWEMETLNQYAYRMLRQRELHKRPTNCGSTRR